MASLSGIPVEQPFSDAMFDGSLMDYDGKERVFGTCGVVSSDAEDWVLVGLAGGPTPFAVQPGFITEDGDIVNTDGFVTAPDFNLWNAATTSGATGYQPADCNLDRFVPAPDFNLWNANSTWGAASQVP